MQMLAWHTNFKDMSVAYNSVFYFLHMYRLEENLSTSIHCSMKFSVSVDHLDFVRYHNYSSMKNQDVNVHSKLRNTKW